MVIEAIGTREQGRRFAYTERHLHKMERDVPTRGPVTVRPETVSVQTEPLDRTAALPAAHPLCGPAARYRRVHGRCAPLPGQKTNSVLAISRISFRIFLAYQSAGVQFVFRKAG